MSSSSGHPLNLSEQQKTVYMSEDNPGPITMSNNTTCITNHEVSKEQQIVYGTAPVLYQPYRMPQAYGCAQPTANSQIVNQYSPSHIVNQQQYYQQQVPLNNIQLMRPPQTTNIKTIPLQTIQQQIRQ